MKFPPSFLDEIRARVSVSSIIGRSVQWDRRKSNPGRGDFWACCPFHHEKTPSFHAEDRKGRYHCFGCKASGDIFTFLVEKEGVPFPEAVERLAQEAGLPMPQISPEAEAAEARRTSLYEVMELAARFFEERLQHPSGARARDYVEGRDISEGIRKEFRLGYAPDGKYNLKTFLAEKNVSAEQMIESGLLVSGEDIPVAYDRFRDRLMFPIRDARGRVIAFGGRALRPDAQPKYLNSPDTPLFHKGRVLYNLDRARGAAHEKGSIVAAEGYMDVIAFARAGLTHAVAPLGTALTEDQLRLLWKMAAEPILCFDGDEAGRKAAVRALDLALPLLAPGHSLRFAMLPEGLDPDDLLKAEGKGALAAALASAQPLIDVLWRNALETSDRSTPERRAEFEARLAEAAARIGEQRVRAHYQAELRDRLRVLWTGQNQTGGRPSAPFDRRSPFRQGPRRGGRFLPDRPWEVQMPASRELRALTATAGAQRVHARRERLILVALIHHPGLLDTDTERLSECDFVTPELDRLRREILDIAALYDGLDSLTLKNHLMAKGHEGLLSALESEARRLGAWFVSRDAALSDARIGFLQMMTLHHKTVTLQAALDVAERRLAEEPSEQALSHLNDIRAELVSSLGEEAVVEGFGEASGRPGQVIA
ncbi:MAG: DNA primase [Parvibaculaceae bacterium]